MRHDGKTATFSARNCEWILSNKMGCEVQTSPPSCDCMKEVMIFEHVICLPNNEWQCIRNDGKKATFKASNCGWIKQNKMGCKTSILPSTSQCDCMAEVSLFREVTCLGNNKWQCIRTDGRKAKFLAKNCAWIRANKMKCAFKNDS